MMEIYLLICITVGQHCDDDVETVLAAFHSKENADRNAARLTAEIGWGEKGIVSYRVDALTAIPDGTDYTGPRFG